MKPVLYSDTPHMLLMHTGRAGKVNRLHKNASRIPEEAKTMIELAQGKLIEQSQVHLKNDLNFWGAEATAKRILDLAKSLAGEDRSKISLLRDAVMEGFRQAEAILGGLPEVSRETYRLVMEGFDQWEKGSFEGKA